MYPPKYRRVTMARRVLPWLPWLLAEATLAWLEVQFWPYGGLWLLTTKRVCRFGGPSHELTRIERRFEHLEFGHLLGEQ